MPNGTTCGTWKSSRRFAKLLTGYSIQVVDVTDTVSVEEVIIWWEELTGRGGEGMVVKPLDFIVRGRRGPTQPAVKCRGPEYLRIIYGPEYLLPENLERLRGRVAVRCQPSALWHSASLLLVLKPLNDLSAKSPSAGYMNASSVCWPSKASQSIPASSPGRLQRYLLETLCKNRKKKRKSD